MAAAAEAGRTAIQPILGIFACAKASTWENRSNANAANKLVAKFLCIVVFVLFASSLLLIPADNLG